MAATKHKIDWILAHDIKSEIINIVKKVQFTHVIVDQVICFRSYHSSSRARARIWSFPRIWQLALNLPPYYVIEVLSQHYDKLSPDDKRRVLIHELLHIPQNFSGSLLPHRGRGRRIDSRSVERLFRQYVNYHSWR